MSHDHDAKLLCSALGTCGRMPTRGTRLPTPDPRALRRMDDKLVQGHLDCRRDWGLTGSSRTAAVPPQSEADGGQQTAFDSPVEGVNMDLPNLGFLDVNHNDVFYAVPRRQRGRADANDQRQLVLRAQAPRRRLQGRAVTDHVIGRRGGLVSRIWAKHRNHVGHTRPFHG